MERTGFERIRNKEAFKLKKEFADSVLIGERQGKKCEGFDYGNSPSVIQRDVVKGKTVIHTTSAGTQGIVAASISLMRTDRMYSRRRIFGCASDTILFRL